MRDLISRQAAIDAISYSEIAYYPGDYDSEVLRRDSVVKAAILSIVPIDAEPERKKGYWIYSSCDGEMIAHKCSVCKRHAGYSLKWMRWYNFCPWCGAELRGGEDGNKLLCSEK